MPRLEKLVEEEFLKEWITSIEEEKTSKFDFQREFAYEREAILKGKNSLNELYTLAKTDNEVFETLASAAILLGDLIQGHLIHTNPKLGHAINRLVNTVWNVGANEELQKNERFSNSSTPLPVHEVKPPELEDPF